MIVSLVLLLYVLLLYVDNIPCVSGMLPQKHLALVQFADQGQRERSAHVLEVRAHTHRYAIPTWITFYVIDFDHR